MPGFDNIKDADYESVVYADNASFDGTERDGILDEDGQIWIGSSVGSPIPAKILDGTGINVSNSPGAITIAVDSSVATTFSNDTGSITLIGNEVRFLEGSNVTITRSGNSFTFASTASSSFTWSVVLGTSQGLVAENGYIANNAALVTFTLPATCTIGDGFQILGKGAGLFRVAQNAGQTIVFGQQTTTLGVAGRIDAAHRRDCVELICTETDVEFMIVDSIGNLTVV